MTRLNPIRDSHVPTVLGAVPAVVVDGESDSDVRDVARRACGSETPPLLAGPAALAGALVDFVPLSRGRVRPLPQVPRCLVVNGSLHPVSAAQIKSARDHGCLRTAGACLSMKDFRAEVSIGPSEPENSFTIL